MAAPFTAAAASALSAFHALQLSLIRSHSAADPDSAPSSAAALPLSPSTLWWWCESWREQGADTEALAHARSQLLAAAVRHLNATKQVKALESFFASLQKGVLHNPLPLPFLLVWLWLTILCGVLCGVWCVLNWTELNAQR